MPGPTMRRWRSTLGLTFLVCVLAPTSAGAATTIGQTAPAPATFTCVASTTFLQSDVDSGSPSYTVAGGGVITSWSTQAVNSSGKDAELKLFNPTGPTTFTVDA